MLDIIKQWIAASDVSKAEKNVITHKMIKDS